MPPTISVLMPVYNAADYLDQAVQSILDQTFGDFELICVNDGSTDRSPEMLSAWARRDKRVQLLSRENTGIVGALNAGLAAVQGEFVARMDADDIALPARFERQIDYLRRHHDCIVLGTKAIVMDQEGSPVSYADLPLDHATIDGRHVGGKGIQMFHPSVMIRRPAIETVGGYRKDFEFAEDLDLFLRLAEAGGLANLPDFLLRYRHHANKTSLTRADLQRRRSIRAVAEACQRRGLPSPPSNDEDVPRVEVSAMDQKKYYVRAAIESGFLGTARKHAWRIWRQEPFSLSGWSLLFRSLTGMKAATASRLAHLARPRAKK
jgi:glycosyltransferase involved in cell wall biosynthesis